MHMMNWTIWWLVLLAATSLIVIYFDMTRRIIPNRAIIVLMVFGIFSVYISQEYNRIYVLLIVLTVGVVLSKLNILGGGDSKLLAVFSLYISVQYVPVVLIIIFLIGGALAAFFWLMYEVTKQSSWLKRGIPYALPICVGSLIGAIASF